jgi:ferredoxin/nitrate reductase gamma subunit
MSGQLSTTIVEAKLKPEFSKTIMRLGAEKFYRCFNCGNCTAICPLTQGRASYPRKLIRYAVMGLEDRVTSSADPWLCYYCGECSDYCPRDADPGSFMMALRRLLIQKYSIVSKLFFNKMAASITWTALTIIAALGLYFFRGHSPNLESVDIFSFIPLSFIHDAGLAIGIIVGLSALLNLISMYRSIAKSISYPHLKIEGKHLGIWVKNFFRTIIYEVAAQLKYNKCLKRSRYIAHLALLWGFIGLFIATLVIFGIDFYGLQMTKVIPFIIGSVSGAAMLYGSLYFIIARLRKKEAYSTYSYHTDWVFLILLFLAGVTGFLLTIFIKANMPTPSYVMFAVHLIIVFNLLISAPFTKFAHAIYRPLALWINSTIEEALQYGGKSAVR